MEDEQDSSALVWKAREVRLGERTLSCGREFQQGTAEPELHSVRTVHGSLKVLS